MIRAMIDLESMGIGPKAAIVAIGVVTFDNTQILSSFYSTISLESSMKVGLEVDASTILWWLNQSKEAQNEFKDSKLTLLEVMESFHQYISKVKPDEIWANGYKDFQWCESANKVCNLKPSWPYSIERDFRTFKNCNKRVKISDEEIAHKALSDAIWQARYMLQLNKETNVLNIMEKV